MKELVEEIQTMMEGFMKNANAQVENGIKLPEHVLVKVPLI